MALPWLRAPLPTSFRRKTVAVLQTVALLVVMIPSVPRAVSEPVAGIALLALVLSFVTDAIWLKRSAA
jgi:hypothetical protein